MNVHDAPHRRFTFGQHVRIVGLVGSAHLNGTPAIVLELDVPCAEGSAGDDGDRPGPTRQGGADERAATRRRRELRTRKPSGRRTDCR
jgi:hypothetical protein